VIKNCLFEAKVFLNKKTLASNIVQLVMYVKLKDQNLHASLLQTWHYI